MHSLPVKSQAGNLLVLEVKRVDKYNQAFKRCFQIVSV